MKLYSPEFTEPLFPFPIGQYWKVLTDTRTRKCLTNLTAKLGYTPNHFTFHCFRQSRSSLAYNSHVTLHDIELLHTHALGKQSLWQICCRGGQIVRGAYNHTSLQHIKQHGTWMSNCVYTQKDKLFPWIPSVIMYNTPLPLPPLWFAGFYIYMLQ